MMLVIITSIIISSHSEIDNQDLNESIYSYITLKIGNWNNKFYSDSYTNEPKIVYINEIKKTVGRD